mmetsp:Transcript_15916/g.43181  ORF Transcript_15916/g.43181 Transcript_15916/m.43181 type:complete len:214 (+) Transcript_15916:437-1078(+)
MRSTPSRTMRMAPAARAQTTPGRRQSTSSLRCWHTRCDPLGSGRAPAQTRSSRSRPPHRHRCPSARPCTAPWRAGLRSHTPAPAAAAGLSPLPPTPTCGSCGGQTAARRRQRHRAGCGRSGQHRVCLAARSCSIAPRAPPGASHMPQWRRDPAWWCRPDHGAGSSSCRRRACKPAVPALPTRRPPHELYPCWHPVMTPGRACQHSSFPRQRSS